MNEILTLNNEILFFEYRTTKLINHGFIHKRLREEQLKPTWMLKKLLLITAIKKKAPVYCSKDYFSLIIHPLLRNITIRPSRDSVWANDLRKYLWWSVKFKRTSCWHQSKPARYLLLLLLKPAAQAQVENTKLFINCCTHEPIQHSGVKCNVGKVIPHSNLSRQERPSKLGRSTPWYFKPQWMSRGRSSGMSNSTRSRWKLAEQTVIRVGINLVQHTKHSHVDDTTTRNCDRDKAWPPNIPGAHEAEGDILQLTPTQEHNTHWLGEQTQIAMK